MQRLEVSGAVRPLYVSLGFKGLRGLKETSRIILQNKVLEMTIGR
jgi:hypothetical protein